MAQSSGWSSGCHGWISSRRARTSSIVDERVDERELEGDLAADAGPARRRPGRTRTGGCWMAVFTWSRSAPPAPAEQHRHRRRRGEELEVGPGRDLVRRLVGDVDDVLDHGRQPAPAGRAQADQHLERVEAAGGLQRPRHQVDRIVVRPVEVVGRVAGGPQDASPSATTRALAAIGCHHSLWKSTVTESARSSPASVGPEAVGEGQRPPDGGVDVEPGADGGGPVGHRRQRVDGAVVGGAGGADQRQGDHPVGGQAVQDVVEGGQVDAPVAVDRRRWPPPAGRVPTPPPPGTR